MALPAAALLSPSSPTRQLRHLVGLADLMDWLNRWRGTIGAVSQAGPILVLGEQPSERFAVALPRHKAHGKSPVLLFQADEAGWATQIKWARAQRVEDGLALIAQRQLGVGDLPSLPAFALIIQLRGQAATVPFEKTGRLDMRKFWSDEGRWEVEGGRPFQAVPVTPSTQALFGMDDLKQGATFRELVRQRALRGSVEKDPGYRGGATDLSQFSQDFFIKTSQAPKST